MKYIVLLLISFPAHCGPFIEWGLGVPFKPVTGYMPDMYGMLVAGYRHDITDKLSLDIQIAHRSVTGPDYCNNGDCDGDNVAETKFHLEW